MEIKKIIAAAAALTMLCSCAGCSASDSESNTQSSTAAMQAEITSSAASDNSSEKSEQGSSDDIKELSAKIDELSAKIEELKSGFEDLDNSFDYEKDYHDIYDDTAVIEAYKKGDSSALTTNEDKFIYDSLVKAIDSIIKDGMSDFDKEKAVYDFIFYGSQFDLSDLNPMDDFSEDHSHDPYGFFHDHSTICVGNATTFKLFMDAIGIECEIIHSTEEGEHAWDIVKIDNEWYHVDITFDGGSDTPLYSRFNVTDDIKLMDHYYWDPDEFHECTSLKYNYAAMNAVDCSSIYDIPAMIAKKMDSDDKSLYLRLPVPDNTDADVYSMQISVLADAIESEKYAIEGTIAAADEENNCVIIGLRLIDFTEPDLPDPELPDDIELNMAEIDINKLRSKFEEAFGGKLTLSQDIEDSLDEDVMYYYYMMYGDLLQASPMLMEEDE